MEAITIKTALEQTMAYHSRGHSHSAGCGSFVDIYAKVEFDASADASDQIAALREFISEAEVVGRIDIEPLGDIGLSIVGPEQYRNEIIRAIPDEICSPSIKRSCTFNLATSNEVLSCES